MVVADRPIPTLGAGLSVSPLGSGSLEWDFCVLFGFFRTFPKRRLCYGRKEPFVPTAARAVGPLGNA
jgi:hypothetical protein